MFFFVFLLISRLFLASSTVLTSSGDSSLNIPPRPRILFIQPSDPDYNTQSWEINLPYTLVELSQLDIMNYIQYHHYFYQRYLVHEHLDQDLHPVWSKVMALHHAAVISPIEWDYIVVLDLDIFIMNYTVSIEQKIHEWDPHHHAMVYMPSDTDVDTSYLTPQGSDVEVLNVNTGFQIWRINSITKEFIKQWKNCITDIPGCRKWDYQWPFDQGAFNEYIRPLITSTTLESDGNLFHIIPCDEANGFPSDYENYVLIQPEERHELGNHGCNGRFVSHFWEETKRYNHERLQRMIFEKYMKQNLELIRRNHLVNL